MRKDARKAVFGGERHQAVEKFFRFVNKDGARTRQGAREARGSKEVQLELFTLPR